MLIAIDHGNYAIKTVDDIFVAGLSEHATLPPLASDIIEFGGRFWALSGSRIPYMRDKTKDDRYFILTLFAVARQIKPKKGEVHYSDVDLAVGLPPEHYSILKDKFAGYFKRGAVEYEYNGSLIALNIKNVFVYPQAYAAVVPQSRMLMDAPRMFVIDIGGYTTDVLLLRGGKPDLQFCRSLEIGVITMNNDIIGKVSAMYDIKIEDDHISDVIQGRETILPASAAAAIQESAKKHADMILDKLRELQVDLRSNPAIFIGGGSILYSPYIAKSPMVVKADMITDPKTNAAGYAMLASSQLKKLV
jgi:plasmid segregation protein ParM